MNLRTCYGCAASGQPCSARDTIKSSLRGLGITSVKWKCQSRQSKFEIGDQVWVDTYESYDQGAERADFPGTVVRVLGGKALVYIRPDARSECLDYSFITTGNGFCKIPFSRLRRRTGAREDVCRDCHLPSSFGHLEGYICALAARLPKEGE